MFLEIKNSIVTKYPENIFGSLKTGQNEKSYIFWEIDIPQISGQLFENVQNLISLQVWCLQFTKIFEWFTKGTALG